MGKRVGKYAHSIESCLFLAFFSVVASCPNLSTLIFRCKITTFMQKHQRITHLYSFGDGIFPELRVKGRRSKVEGLKSKPSAIAISHASSSIQTLPLF